MQKDETTSLFEVRLNQEGIDSIRRFSKIARWVMLLIIVSSSISLIDVFTNYYLIKGRYVAANKLVAFINQFYPFYVVIYFLLANIQSYNFLKTAKHLSGAINNNDEESFNRAFLYLYRNAIFGLVGLLLYSAMTSFRFFVLIETYYNK